MKKPMIVTFAMAATMLLALATTGGPADGTDDREMAYTEVNKAFTTMRGDTEAFLNTGENEASVTFETTDVIGASGLENDVNNDNNDSNSMVISLENSDSAYLLDSTTYTYNDFEYAIYYSADGIATYDAADPEKPADAKAIIKITKYYGGGGVVEIPAKIDSIPVTIIGANAFAGSEISGVVFPDSLRSIEAYAFGECHNLSEVVLPDGLVHLGNWAFYKEHEERDLSVTIPNSVTEIEGDLFGMEHMYGESLILCKNDSYAYYLFKNPDSVGRESFNGTVIDISEFAFEYTVYDDYVVITGFSGHADEVTIPETIEGKPVTSISGGAFRKDNLIEVINISKNVSFIDFRAFGELQIGGCLRLKEINVVNNNAVYASSDGVLFDKQMNKLIRYPGSKETIIYNVPETVTCIGEYAFAGFNNLEEVNLPEGAEVIEQYAFQADFRSDSSIIKISIPDTVYEISENEAFSPVGNFIIICSEDSYAYQYACGHNIKVNDEYDFEDELGIVYRIRKNNAVVLRYDGVESEVSIPDEIEGKPVTEIMGFYDWCGVERVVVPETVTIIGDYAFSGCYNLEEITIKGKATIGSEAFCACYNLRVIRIEDEASFVGSQFFFGYSSAVIYCYENSTAHTYAIENNIPSVLIEETAITPGDINGDGVVDNKDLLLMRRYLADSVANALSADGFLAADISGDGEVNNQDLIRLRRIIAAN